MINIVICCKAFKVEPRIMSNMLWSLYPCILAFPIIYPCILELFLKQLLSRSAWLFTFLLGCSYLAG